MRLESDKFKIESFMSAMGKRVRDNIIEPQLIRYPSVDPAAFRAAVTEFCNEHR